MLLQFCPNPSVCAALWVLAGAAEAECFTVTEVNADFLDGSSCSVAFSHPIPKKTMHLRSRDRAGATWMGIELVLICWYLGGNRAFVKFFLAVRGVEAFSCSPLNSLFNLNSLLEWQGIKTSGKLKPYIKHLCIAEVWQCQQNRWILYNLCLLKRIKGKFYRLDLWSQRNSLSFVWVAWQNWVHWTHFHLVFNKQKCPM